ncbi:unnamed protein product [Blepharisma stoltei]|uniref:Uncharacterized protein n=1 Tax=Blepharisma stoltei TaxID=1481888 RepID=A0AAU9IP13_9CILI|nr:unnamed protein product [Blepharisma stoltei]
MEFHYKSSNQIQSKIRPSFDLKAKKNMAKSYDYSIIKPAFNKEIQITGQTIFLVSGILMEVIVVINIIWSCVSTFDCSIFWPTVSYLACFRGHDRLFNFTMAFYAFITGLFFITAHVHFFKIYTPRLKLFYTLLSAGIVLAFPFISMIDEGNSSHVVPLEKIHYWIMIGFICGVLAWIYMSLLCINAISIPKENLIWKDFLLKYLAIGFAILLVNLYEYKYAYTEQANWFTNQNVEAACEWMVISMTVFLPFIYSLVFPSVRLRVKVG